MTDGLKDRPALLRRTPRPAPDEKVDPVDYSPAAVAPAPQTTVTATVATAEPVPGPASAGGGVELEPATALAEVNHAPIVQPVVEAAPIVAAPPAPKRQAPRSAKSSKQAVSRKTSRREITFPLSTRISLEVSETLYSAAEDEGISVREVIEQAIMARWGRD